MSTSASVLLAIISCLEVFTDVSQPESNQFIATGWNVDSGQADPHLAALRVARFQGVHLWGLCEVKNSQWAELFVRAAGENEPGEFIGIISRTGGTDQSCIIYDTTRFDLVRSFEIDWADRLWYCPRMPIRPPLVAHLRHRATGQELLFMVDRMYGCRIDMQAEALNAWASAQTLPLVAVGTYDFQYDPETGPLCPDGQKALLALIADGVFHWLAPDNPVSTFNWDRDVIDDFVFLANTSGRLSGQSRIVVEPGDFAGGDTASNHRPVQATLNVR
ncbi:MAG: hypothetical protein JW993_18115 [Sedimentisphaerales bacterium]|nr:hypothetical protein [Sedimentisphaerales bacterium]